MSLLLLPRLEAHTMCIFARGRRPRYCYHLPHRQCLLRVHVTVTGKARHAWLPTAYMLLHAWLQQIACEIFIGPTSSFEWTYADIGTLLTQRSWYASSTHALTAVRLSLRLSITKAMRYVRRRVSQISLLWTWKHKMFSSILKKHVHWHFSP